MTYRLIALTALLAALGYSVSASEVDCPKPRLADCDRDGVQHSPHEPPDPPDPPDPEPGKSNAGRGNGSEGNPDRDPGNSGKNKGGD